MELDSPEFYNFHWKKTRHLRENESVTVNPFGVLWVVVHELVEKNVGNWGHSPTQPHHQPVSSPGMFAHLHRSARMAGVRLEGSIDLLEEELARLSGF